MAIFTTLRGEIHNSIRGVSKKYPTCVHISALVLFFIIRTVASFEEVPIWLNHTLLAVRPHLKAVLELRFWNGLQLGRRITLNRLDVVEPLSFERHFPFWEHPKVAGTYVGTVWRLAKLYNLVFRQICCTRFDECAGALSWWRSQSPLDQKRGRFLLTASRNLFRTSP